MNNKTLGLFFSYGVGVETWEKQGYLNRELKYYTKLSQQLGKVSFFTYDSKQKFQKTSFEDGKFGEILIFSKESNLPNFLYSFLMVFLYGKMIKQCDILKTNQMSAVVPAIIAKVIYKKKLVVRCGYEWLYSLIKAKKPFWKKVVVYCLEWVAYKMADIIIFTSKADKAFAQKIFKIKESKIAIVPNYIDTDLFKPLSNVKKEPNSVCYVGRLSKEKNVNLLIGAISELPETKLYIAGEGPLKQELQQQAIGLGLKERVVFLGKVPNEQLPQLLNKCVIFSLPSSYEGNPKALLEARGCGTTLTIGSDIEGNRDIINHNKDGYLHQPTALEIKKMIKNCLKEAVRSQSEYQSKVKKAREDTILKSGLESVLQKELDMLSDIYYT